MTYDEMTGGWFPELPRAHDKSVVLGAGLVLHPCPDPEKQAAILSEYASQLVLRAYRAGRSAAKLEIRKALWD